MKEIITVIGFILLALSIIIVLIVIFCIIVGILEMIIGKKILRPKTDNKYSK